MSSAGRRSSCFSAAGLSGRESCLQPIVTAARTRLPHMDYYLLEYALIDDYLARRAASREAHLALAGKPIAVGT